MEVVVVTRPPSEKCSCRRRVASYIACSVSLRVAVAVSPLNPACLLTNEPSVTSSKARGSWCLSRAQTVVGWQRAAFGLMVARGASRFGLRPLLLPREQQLVHGVPPVRAVRAELELDPLALLHLLAHGETCHAV